jgi:hypothetical protein
VRSSSARSGWNVTMLTWSDDGSTTGKVRVG